MPHALVRIACLLCMLLGCHYTWQRVRQTPDVAIACDPFGHLQHVQALRQAWETGTAPRFDLTSPQSEAMIAGLRSLPGSSEAWAFVVGPHAFTYRERSGLVVNQYTPGAACVLFAAGEIFGDPEHCARSLLALVVIGALVLWLALLAWEVRHPNPVALCLATASCGYLTFVIRDYTYDNPSTAACLLPLTLGCLAVLAVGRESRAAPWRAFAFAGLGGALLGFCVFIRPPNALLLPFFVFRTRGLARWTFVAAACVAGALPLLVYQSAHAGAWYASTYSSVDTAPPSLAVVWRTLGFYLFDPTRGGPNARVALGVLAVTAAAFGGRGVTRGLLVWLPSLLFFLTHTVAETYYLVPTFVAMAATSTWFAFREGSAVARSRTALGLALLAPWLSGSAPDIAAGGRFEPLKPSDEARQYAREGIPAELLQSRAWIWSDLYSGTFWYYAGKPAFKIAFGATRQLSEGISKWAHSRGEPQFLVRDGADMDALHEDWKRKGAIMTPRGQVFGRDYEEVRWP